jgi:hypothetical protein
MAELMTVKATVNVIGSGVIPLSESKVTATIHGRVNTGAFHGLTSRKNRKRNKGHNQTAISMGRSPPERNKESIARNSQPYTNTNDFVSFIIFPSLKLFLRAYCIKEDLVTSSYKCFYPTQFGCKQVVSVPVSY